MPKGTLRTCDNGHRYYKSSDCPTCPVCENERKPQEGFLSFLPAPARRALEHAQLTSLSAIAAYGKGNLLKLHGLGPSTIKKLLATMKKQGLTFKE
ncbi:MAG TPA: hypothetical protein VGD65_08560 [Chryseosolibacter sp.]